MTGRAYFVIVVLLNVQGIRCETCVASNSAGHARHFDCDTGCCGEGEDADCCMSGVAIAAIAFGCVVFICIIFAIILAVVKYQNRNQRTVGPVPDNTRRRDRTRSTKDPAQRPRGENPGPLAARLTLHPPLFPRPEFDKDISQQTSQ
ncbi:uncharacterized protein LOC125380930 [Haliotis rufescens]|uniref:uncharacterized protein LOC125380930 n=1 Tax=Haliotis rufescens TaxID=6454 RepID=UPI00201E9C5F|nr:uncharacterized protein LOC125380930 [Haliotis rufescens]